MSGPAPRSVQFRRERETAWRELERLVARSERGGPRSLAAADLARLPRLYRGALSSLSVARAISLDRNVLDYLEGLCGRAYACVYGVRRGLKSALARFFGQTFPATVRDRAGILLLAALGLVLGAVVGAALTAADPSRYYSFVPQGLAGGRHPGASTQSLREALYHEEALGDRLVAFAAFLFTHNAQVGIFAFALGFAAGLPTFLLLFSNGLTLGAFAWLYASRGLSWELWAWLLPHGIPELFAVVLCGAAGLAVAKALLFPGARARAADLAAAGREAGVLVVGAVVLLFVAGLVEGIFRQTVHDVGARYLFALLMAGAVGSWILLPGRRRP